MSASDWLWSGNRERLGNGDKHWRFKQMCPQGSAKSFTVARAAE